MALPYENEARRWLADDPDPDTRATLQRWLDEGDAAALEEAFGARLQFGTAGLRGTLGPGPGHMNRALVRRAAAGLARHLLELLPEATSRGVVVGGDARILSEEFAEDSARVLAGHGIPVRLFGGPVPTPFLAWAVKERNAAAGIMVTASHNPPAYNGYKVYWEGGAQIVPPVDRGISAAIDAVESVAKLPFPTLPEARERGLLSGFSEDDGEAYLHGLLALQRQSSVPRELTVVYTALHGVGGVWVKEALERAGVERVVCVAEQQEPDGRFPTVDFPNPEEPGAMDLALAAAREHGADLVLANDPDADRLAVAVPDGDGGFVQLSGNDVGVLLGEYLLAQHDGARGEPLAMTTIVSSRLLSRIAEARGAHYRETLTGFKWIATGAARLREQHGWRLVLGYEEALGYTVGELVADKDGIGAALLVAELAAVCRAAGGDLRSRLQALHREFGLHLDRQHSLVLEGSDGRERAARILARFREEPPVAIAGRPVLEAIDYSGGHGGLPPSNVLAFLLEGGARVLLRPSGTEPKLKFYFEVAEPVGEGEDYLAARERATGQLDALAADTLRQAEA